MPRSCSIFIQSEVAWRAALRPLTLPANWIAPPKSSSFSVTVVLPASGCEMMAKVRRRDASDEMDINRSFLSQIRAAILRASRSLNKFSACRLKIRVSAPISPTHYRVQSFYFNELAPFLANQVVILCVIQSFLIIFTIRITRRGKCSGGDNNRLSTSWG